MKRKNFLVVAIIAITLNFIGCTDEKKTLWMSIVWKMDMIR